MSRRKRERSKARSDWAYGIVNVGPDHEIRFNYDAENEAIEIVGAEAGSTKFERSYERDSGKAKVETSIPSDGSIPFNAERALFAYQRIVAIDTNSRVIAGKRCAVCFSYYVPDPPSSYTNAVPYVPLGALLIVGVAQGVNPETIGWHLTLTHFLAPYRPSAHGRLAVVTDSELGRHNSINARKVGYYGEDLLPDGMTMVYASDIDNETLQGRMIRACDVGATAIADEYLKRDHLPELSKSSGDPNFEAFVQVIFHRE